MNFYLVTFFVILNISKLSFAQSTSSASSTEIIANGRADCPAADSQDYQIVPYMNNGPGNFRRTNITSVSIVSANGGPPIVEFPYNRPTAFVFLNPTPPYTCSTCYEPIRMSNHTTVVRDIVALFNGTYYDDGSTPTIACQSEYERPNVVFKFETNDGRTGEWVITSEHVAIVRPVFDSETSDPNLCNFFLAPYYVNERQISVVLGDFHARHYCLTHNTAEQTVGLASASFIP